MKRPRFNFVPSAIRAPAAPPHRPLPAPLPGPRGAPTARGFPSGPEPLTCGRRRGGTAGPGSGAPLAARPDFSRVNGEATAAFPPSPFASRGAEHGARKIKTNKRTCKNVEITNTVRGPRDGGFGAELRGGRSAPLRGRAGQAGPGRAGQGRSAVLRRRRGSGAPGSGPAAAARLRRPLAAEEGAAPPPPCRGLGSAGRSRPVPPAESSSRARLETLII